MTPDWTTLDAELAHWGDVGMSLPLWWRDDDAIAPTPDLARLTDMSARLDIPVHLAVIPCHAETALADFVVQNPTLIPVTHGWAHQNHAFGAEKKAEFGAHRPLDQIVRDAAQGQARMHELFGNSAGLMFVPPWNRIADQAVAALPGLGYTALSTFTPRAATTAVPGLAQINTHLDPIGWKTGKSLVDPTVLIEQVTRQLRDRRKGRADASEPYGILTHHLVHDAEIWSFTEQLLTRLLAGPGTCWTLTDLTKDITK